jgi:hypothetical protein
MCFINIYTFYVHSLTAEEVKRSGKAKKTDKHASSKENNLERHVEVSTANADEIPSVDEDSSRGMKSNILLLSFDLSDTILLVFSSS